MEKKIAEDIRKARQYEILQRRRKALRGFEDKKRWRSSERSSRGSGTTQAIGQEIILALML